ncbi:MAG: hypothetical protein PHI27_06320 [Eubacteriales bacterium]|nr:hypothetical protein [Eubacteriales bacterium]MDD3881849.1 hypothetical protein [Eubacteriales bacterium]MDD4512905.1 hypothetical protein [Eubacteriales bacterium]
MKKCLRIACCLLILCFAFPIAGLAQTQDEWNLSCKHKLRVSSDVYSQTLEGFDDYSPYYITTLPANTYVKKSGGTNDFRRITWMDNGTTKSGYVLSKNITYCISDAVSKDGTPLIIHELDPNHDDIVNTNKVIAIAPSLLETRP